MTLSVVEFADGLLLTEADLGMDPNDTNTEAVIAAVMRMGEEDGVKFEGRGRETDGGNFHLGGADIFCWEPGEDDGNGNDAVLIELVEDD